MRNHFDTSIPPNSNPQKLLKRIYKQWRPDYVKQCIPARHEIKCMNNVCACRTPEIQRGYRDLLPNGKYGKKKYHRCGSRACPKCHIIQKNKSVKDKMAKWPHCSYSLLTLTVPQQLYVLFRYNPKVMYGLLKKSFADAVKEFADECFGGLPVFWPVIHSWNNNMTLHPHLHAALSNGGWRDGEWIEPKNPYWFPYDKVLERTKELFLKALLKDRPYLYHPYKDQSEVYQLIQKHIKQGKKGGWNLDYSPYGSETKTVTDEHGNDKEVTDHTANLEKLLRYLTRDCLAAHRITNIDSTHVTIEYTKRRSNQVITERIRGIQYIERYMLHQLPKGVPRSTPYHLLHSSKKAELKKAKKLFDKQRQESGTFIDHWFEQSEQVVQEHQEQSDKTIGGYGNKPHKPTRIFFQNIRPRKSHFTYGRASPDIPNVK